MSDFVEIKSKSKTALDSYLFSKERNYVKRLPLIYQRGAKLTDIFYFHYIGVRDGKHTTWQMRD